MEAQSGFRKSMGTVVNIFILHGVINQFLNENKKLYVAFIDFTKAFDYVIRDILWYKLLKYGVGGGRGGGGGGGGGGVGFQYLLGVRQVFISIFICYVQ